MSIALIIALVGSASTPPTKPVAKDEVTCSQVVVSNSRFTRRECISKSNAARRSKNAELAWHGLQNATGPTPSEGL